MADVSVRGISKTFRGRVGAVLAEVDFDVPAGEMLVLLGPSGCGKTTTLRCLAGLEQPDSGSIHFGARPIVDLKNKTFVPPHRRDVGLVFQSFALWPHLTIRRNIEFPLRARRRSAGGRKDAVEAALAMVELPSELLNKRPYQLSGGQQQRVSLARALVAEPAVVLFDEPLSSLDAQLRVQVRSELHKLHRRLGFTGVYVTHDLSEALALGTRVAVMGGGRIQQIGPPSEVFDRPASVAVAKLFGYSRLRFEAASGGSSTAYTAAAAYVRPDRLHIRRQGTSIEPGRARASGLSVSDVSYLGSLVEFTIQDGAHLIRIPLASDDPLAVIRPGETVDVDAWASDLRLLGEGSEVGAGSTPLTTDEDDGTASVARTEMPAEGSLRDGTLNMSVVNGGASD